MNWATGDQGQTSRGPRLPSTGPVDADAEHRWRTLVEMSALAVLIVDDHGLVVYANPQAAGLCGVATADDAIGRNAAEFADPVSVDALLVDAAGTRVTDRSLTFVRADGSHVPAQVNAAAVRYAGAWCVQLEIRDLSRQVAVEQAARDAEARARSLIEQSPIGVAIADENFRFVEVNPAVCTILGRSATELIGLDSATLDLDNRTPEEITEQGDTIIDGLNGTEVRFTHPDGGERWLWLGISPFAGPQGQSWSLGHAIDVTGQKHAETARRESEADVAAVTAVVQKMQSGGDARQIIVEAAMSLAGASFAALLEPAFGDSALIVTAATLELVVGAEIDLDGDSVPARGYLTGEPVFVADAQEHPGVPQELLELGAGRSMSAFPVRSGSDVVANWS